MKTGMTLPELAASITATAESARDFILPARALRFTPDGSAAFGVGSEGLMYGINSVAHEQLGTYTGIPRQYYETMRNSSPALLAHNVNHWLDGHGDDKRLIRVAGDKVRAFLSNRYRPLDNYDLAQHVLPIISDLGLRVESCDITERKLYMKCVNERVQGEVTPGDVVQAGVIITNSEVGHGSLGVVPLLFRLICKNGMIRNELAHRKNHTGDKRVQDANLESALEVYADETRKKMDSALWSQVGDLVRAACSEAIFLQIVDKMREARTGEAVSKPVEAVELLRKRFDLTQEDGSGILGHLVKGGDLSRWGVLNAVTRYAQDVESYDKSTDLEKLGRRCPARLRSGDPSPQPEGVFRAYPRHHPHHHRHRPRRDHRRA